MTDYAEIANHRNWTASGKVNVQPTFILRGNRRREGSGALGSAREMIVG
jgi:hypothetical protein